MDAVAHRQAMEMLRYVLELRWKTTPLEPWSYSFLYLSGPIPFNCYAQINPDMEGFLFRAQFSGHTPKENWSRMSRLCEKLNLDMPVGCFAFNSETGDLRWKSGVYFWKQDLSERTIRNVIDPSLLLIDEATTSIVAVYNGDSVEAALLRRGEDLGIGTNDACHYKGEPHPRNVDA